MTTLTDDTSARFANIELDDHKPTVAAQFSKDAGRQAKARVLRGSRGNQHLDAHAARKYDALPDLGDIVERLQGVIEREDRRNVAARLKHATLDDSGRLRVSTADGGRSAPMRLLDAAYRQLASRAPKDVGNPSKYNLNAWTGRGDIKDDKEIVLRTMAGSTPHADRDAFAALSGSYVVHDANQIAARWLAAFEGHDVRGKLRYAGDGGRVDIQAVMAAPRDIAGEPHRLCFVLRTADNGTGSKRLLLRLERDTCTNGMYVRDEAVLKALRHAGSTEKFQRGLDELLGAARDAADRYAYLWGKAREDRFHAVTVGYEEEVTPPQALASLAMNRTIAVPHVRRTAMAGMLIDAWRREPDPSAAGVLNAITRTAWEQASAWKSEWYEDDLEEQASQMLYAQVRRVPALDESQRKALDSAEVSLAV